MDHIRLKSTPNLEVSHNSIYSQNPKGDGITDKPGDSNTPQFTNFISHKNASHTADLTFAIEIDHCIAQTITAGGTPEVVHNYAMQGRVKPNNTDSLFRLTGGQLFQDPNAGNFRIDTTLGMPDSIGVWPEVLDSLDSKIAAFGG